jgi:hypothetical protein
MATKSGRKRRLAELTLEMKRGEHAGKRSPSAKLTLNPLHRSIGVSLERLLEHWPTVKYVFRNR